MAPASTGTFYGQAMTTGDIYTVLDARYSSPQSVTADHAGNLVVAETNAELIQVVAGSTGTFYGQRMTVGSTYTIAGNGGCNYSGDGGLVIADANNHRIRKVTG